MSVPEHDTILEWPSSGTVKSQKIGQSNNLKVLEARKPKDLNRVAKIDK